MSHPVAANKQLQDAFELFYQVSERLSGSYQALQLQVVSLDQKLASSQSERLKLLDEIDTLRQEVSRTQRLSTMGQMTARLAHQIRTPLSTALLYASQLKQKSLRTDQHDCFVDRLMVGLRHLDHMVNDMLVFARGGAGGDEAVSVQELLEQVRQSLLPQFQEYKARWTVTSESNDMLIRGQREVLVSVLTNLATNALNACGQQAHLHWFYTSRGNYVELSIQDNGPGVPKPIAEQIFEPFFTTRSNGTGLGLAVVRAVIDAHGGSIMLDDGFQDGARFMLRLPLIEAQQQLPSEMLQGKKQVKKTANSRCV
jgi:two-component system sensor histidine kinase FlrB